MCTTMSRSVFSFQRTAQHTSYAQADFCIKNNSGEIVKLLAGVNIGKSEFFTDKLDYRLAQSVP